MPGPIGPGFYLWHGYFFFYSVQYIAVNIGAP